MADIDDQVNDDAVEDAEWDAALQDTYPNREDITTQEDASNDDAATTTTTTTETPTTTDTTTEAPVTTTTTTVAPEEGDEKADADKSGDEKETEDNGDDSEGSEEDTRTARQVQRDLQREVKEVADDVRTQMFADEPTKLLDGDGDEIKSIEDVMKLVNPITGEAFTSDEAAQWLLAAQQQLNKNIAEMDNRIDEIANVNVDLKDQADSIKLQYGELLDKMPDLRDQIWNEYEKTLVKDPKTGIITAMPVPLENFYSIALTPYVKLAESLEAQEEQRKQQEAEQEKVDKKLKRVDRSDIFGRGKTDDLDEEDQEWEAAAKSYYGK